MDRNTFEVTDYLSESDIRERPEAIYDVFPAAVCLEIEKRVGERAWVIPTEKAVRAGELSTVHLLDIKRLADRSPTELESDVVDGLIFYFLIVQSRADSGMFTIQETRDFTIDDRSYAEESMARLGRSFEPQTIVEDVVDFFRTVRPDLHAGFESLQNGEAIVAYTLISGGSLTANQRGEVTAHFGWDNELENFTFAFIVPVEE